MISISGTVFGECCEQWEAGELEIKNELILYCERIYIWNWNRHEKGSQRKHIIYVETDLDRPDMDVEEKVDAV